MVLLGLSLIVVSLSFLIYRHPPQSWPPSLVAFRKKWSDRSLSAKEGPVVVVEDESDEESEGKDGRGRDGQDYSMPPPPVPSRSQEDIKKQLLDRQAGPPPSLQAQPRSENLRQLLDRQAMPPPPPPSLASSAPPSTAQGPAHSGETTPKARPSASTTPMPPLTLLDEDEGPAPSFPAPNSAQRTRGPPRLAPLPTPRPVSTAPLPSRTPQSSSNSLRIPATAKPAPLPSANTSSSSSSPKKSRKVLLAPNHSPLDWAALQATLPGPTTLQRIPPSQLRKHASRASAWTALGGTVYDVTPYVPFHPGGERELLRAAGRDGSRLFNEVHPWVNWEGMLAACVVGLLVPEDLDVQAKKDQERWDQMD
ncbi:MAG: hypothetical protein M1838_002649 [Thelocarpon superellum]|nr:MAG: hypothetical protein M1838_002649 [Thelocarpon superellum]